MRAVSPGYEIFQFVIGGGRLGRSGMDLGLTPARGEASSESNLRGDIVEALDELLSELETSIGNCSMLSARALMLENWGGVSVRYSTERNLPTP